MIKDLRDGKDDVCPVADGVEGDWCDEHNDEVDQPIGRSRQGVGRSTNAKWDDLDLIQPSHALPADSEEGAVCKDEDCASDVAATGTEVLHDADEDHTDAHASSAEHHQRATTPEAVDTDDSHEGSKEELGTGAGGDQHGDPASVGELLHEHEGKVLRDQVDARHLLHDLQTKGQDDSV